MKIDRELRGTFIVEYRKGFESQLRTKGPIRSYYLGFCDGIEFVLTKLGVLDSTEISRIQTEVKEEVSRRRYSL